MNDPLITSAWHHEHFLYLVEQAIGAAKHLPLVAGDENMRTYRNALIESFAANIAALAHHLSECGIELKPSVVEARRRFYQEMATLSVFRGAREDRTWNFREIISDIMPDVMFYAEKERHAGRMSQLTLDRLSLCEQATL